MNAYRYFSILPNPWNFMFSFAGIKAIQVPATVALILCIVGATSANTAAEIEAQPTLHAGIILYVVILIALVALTIGAAIGRSKTGRGEAPLIAAVALAMPLLVVRMIYSCLSAFTKISAFQLVGGNQTVGLFMEVLEEMFVVAIFLFVGLKQEAIAKEEVSDSPASNVMYRAGRGDYGSGKFGIIALVISFVRNLGKEDVQENQQDKQASAPRAHHHRRHSHHSQRPVSNQRCMV
jgi:uncharacterized membrane protein